MILTEEYGFRVRDPKLNLAYSRGRPIKFGYWGLDPPRNGGVDGDCRICAAAGDLLLKFTSGEGKEFVGQIGGFSHESEHDLAVMVSDFVENGSGGNESKYSSDSDSGCSDLGHLADRVLVSHYPPSNYCAYLLIVIFFCFVFICMVYVCCDLMR